AAHSQFGDAVAGQEEVAGDGGAADAVEGLVSASVAHAGAAMARGAPDSREESVASGTPGPTGWTDPVESASSGATGWTAPIDLTAAGGWAEPAAPAASADAWSAPVAESGDGAQPASDAAWGVPESVQLRESLSEALALPTDAIRPRRSSPTPPPRTSSQRRSAPLRRTRPMPSLRSPRQTSGRSRRSGWSRATGWGRCGCSRRWCAS